MKTGFVLLALTAIFGFAAIWILEIRPTSSGANPSRPKSPSHRIRRTTLSIDKIIPLRKRGHRRRSRPAASPAFEAVIESSPHSRQETSKILASSKLLLFIIVLGGGMAIIAMLALRLIGIILQQASA